MSAPPGELTRISVGIGQLAVSGDPADILIAYGLGSCVGVSAVDLEARVGGLVHVLLPASEGQSPDGTEPARFADQGIDALIQRLAELGATKRRLQLKVAGGASVLGRANGERFKIGERNAEAVRERLRLHGLVPAATDLGGVRGRTIEVHVASGRTFVRTAASLAVEL